MRHIHHYRHIFGRGPAHRNFSGGGFTLLELLLFTSLAAILISALAAFVSLVLQSRVKQQTIVEVEEQALQVMEQITHDIRSATSITSPSVGTTATSLSLSGTSPTLWEGAQAQFWRTSGSSAPLPLTSSGLVISNVQFSNVSRAQTKGIVRVQFTLARLNPPGRNEYDYSKTFYGSAALR